MSEEKSLVSKNKTNTKWTSAQQNAIYDDGGTLLISAAAGSGKTAVLVERVLRLMIRENNPIDVDKMLIVTFTNAAARELSTRLSARLSQMIKNEPENMLLRRQKMLIGKTNICTMHSFCMHLLQRYFNILNLPADFGVADESDIYNIKEKAMQSTLEEMYKDDAFCEFASLYGKARSDDAVKNAVLALYDYSRSLPNPQKALEKLIDDYNTNLPFTKTLWGKSIVKQIYNSLKTTISLTKGALQIVSEESELINYESALELDILYYNDIKKLIDEDRWDDAIKFSQNHKYANFKSVKVEDKTMADKVKKLRDAAKKINENLQNNFFICSQAEFEEDKIRVKPYLASLCNAVLIFEKEFYNLKLEDKVLEYSDFEHLAIKLLCDENGNKTKEAVEVSKEFEYIMVDEYQDTNAIQEKLYDCLANEDCSNLFYVGDVKQSIYKFRLANPEIFIEKRHTFKQYADESTHPATIILGHNFRSSKNIIDQVNYVFSSLMSVDVGEINYDESEELKKGIQSEFDGGAFEFNIIDTELENAQKDDIEFVANKISDMVANKYQVRDGEGTRDCKYDDFCILLRTREKFTLYQNALNEKNIPVFTDTGESFLTSNEVSSIISLLKVIDNPGQDIHMAATLMSAMFNFTPDDIIKIRTNYPKGRLYSALLKSDMPKAALFCKTLQWLRCISTGINLTELLSEILNFTNYEAIISAMENGDIKRENIRLFIAYASNASQGIYSSSGLTNFLRRIDNSVNMSSASSATPAKNCVSIMTIHRSKGLEFPIVILADAAKQFNFRDSYDQYLFHPILGAGFKLKSEEGGGIFSTAMHSAISFVKTNETKSEQMRILYVALTRAKDKLIVCAPIANAQKTLSNLADFLSTSIDISILVQRQNNFAAWLCIAALLHPNCGNLRKIAQAQTIKLAKPLGEFNAQIFNIELYEKQENKKIFERKSKPDNKLLGEILNNFKIANKIKEDNFALPLKLSVSDISHSKTDFILSRPAFSFSEGLTSAEQGTAQHAFLQYADFKNAKDNLENEIKRLVQKHFISEIIAEKLPREKIMAFLNSDTAKRINNAQKLYKEYDFITEVNANEIYDDLPIVVQDKKIQVQGIVDVLIINNNKAEIIDYKTDKNKTNQQFINTYSKQLLLYKFAIENQFNLKVSKCTIYSFENNIEIPIEL